MASAAAGCEVIYHQGAKRSVPRSIAEPELFTDVNVRGTLNVLLAARAGGRGGGVVLVVYGDQDRFPLVESMFPGPRSPYAASKLAGEAYCRGFLALDGRPAARSASATSRAPAGGRTPPASTRPSCPGSSWRAFARSHPSSTATASRRGTSPAIDVIQANILAGGAGRGPGRVQHRRRRPADLGERGPADRRRPDGRQPEAGIRAVGAPGTRGTPRRTCRSQITVRLHADGRHPGDPAGRSRASGGVRAGLARPPSGRRGGALSPAPGPRYPGSAADSRGAA